MLRFTSSKLSPSAPASCRLASARDFAMSGQYLFRRLFLARFADAHTAGRLAFFGEIRGLVRREALVAHLAPLRRKNWFVYAKPPSAGPEAVLAYLARYTHRVAISNSRLLRRTRPPAPPRTIARHAPVAAVG